MKSVSKKIKIGVAIIVGVVILFAGARVFIFSRLEKRIINHLDTLRSEGYLVRYKSLDVNSWRASVRIMELQITSAAPDSMCSPKVYIPELFMEGISMLSLIFEKELAIKSIFLKHPFSRHVRGSNSARQSKRRKNSLNELEIGTLQIESGTTEIIDSTTCEKLIVNFNFEISQLTIHKPRHDSMTWSAGKIIATALSIEAPAHFYKMKVKQIVYSRGDKSVKIDSLNFSPSVNRATFAKKTGHQVDQFSFVVPNMDIKGFEMGPQFQPSFSAQDVALNFQIDVFRDKRFPRTQKKPKILPVPFLRQLPYQLQIDSIRVSSSFISYEEFPEKGDSAGRIFFNKVRVNISNLSNHSADDAHMNVAARFMNAGDLNANFTFPQESKKMYTVDGALTNFSMPSVNSMLMPIGNVKIESGIMNKMKFQFHYNDARAEGELRINHSDLKVLSLRKDDSGLPNKFISWILGAFIEKDLDKDDGKDKTTGKIQWERDPQRGIINYWWKSVLSGIKDVYNLDKLSGKKGKEKSK